MGALFSGVGVYLPLSRSLTLILLVFIIIIFFLAMIFNLSLMCVFALFGSYLIEEVERWRWVAGPA